jgi:hypothetical protein
MGLTKKNIFQGKYILDSVGLLVKRHGKLLSLFFLATLIYAPYILINGLYWDDWSCYWIYINAGAGALFDSLLDVSHPGSWFPLVFYFSVFGKYVSIFGKIIYVCSHLLNSYLFYRILQRPFTAKIAFYATAIYTLAPFYYVHGMLMVSSSELFIFAYYLSILLMGSEKKIFKVLSHVFLILSFSIETLVMLEPLRLLYSYRGQQHLRTQIKVVTPYWLLIIIFFVIRFTLLQPRGQYAGYNSLDFSLIALIVNLIQHAIYPLKAMKFSFISAYSMVGWLGLVLLGGLGVFLTRLGSRNREITDGHKKYFTSKYLPILLFGSLLILAGALPYALIGRYPKINDFNSRFVIVSIPGMVIFAAALIKSIYSRKIRYFCMYVLLVILGLTSLKVTKWYFYDALIQQDLRRSLIHIIGDREDLPMFKLKMVPTSTEIMFMKRNLGAQDINPPLNMELNRVSNPVFVYDENLKWFFRQDSLICTVTTLDKYPYPGQTINLEYVLNPQYSSVEKISYWELLKFRFTHEKDLPVLGKISSPDNWPVKRVTQDSSN